LLAEQIGVPETALRNNDQMFADSIKEAGNVIMGFTSAKQQLEGKEPYLTNQILIRRQDKVDLLQNLLPLQGVAVNLNKLAKNAAGNGLFMAAPSDDGINRELPLLVRYGNQIYPSLALEAVRVYNNPKESIKIRQADDATNFFSMLDNTAYQIEIGQSGYSIPLKRNGYFTVKYRDMADEYFSIYKLLEGDHINEMRNRVEGKIVLIGTSAEGLKDIRSTPLSVYVAGVEIHANVIEQIIKSSYLYKSERFNDVIAAFMILLGGIIIILLSIKIGPFITAAVSGAIIFAAFWGTYVTYIDYGIIFYPIYPSLALTVIFMAATLLNYLRTSMQAKEVKSAFGQYISPDFMRELTDNPDKLKLGGEQKILSVMFTDIRNFTSISESMSPEELIETMNDFLTPMSDVVMGTRGTIDKYMGDAMMAFWNAPLDDKDHARHAVEAAIKMRSVLGPVNKALKDKARKQGRIAVPLAAGIGVNTGKCSVGNMGSKQRFAYSALGDAVNLASRLEGQTKTYGLDLLIGEDTVNQTIEDFAYIEIDKIKVKGRDAAIHVYTALGDDGMLNKTSFRKYRVEHKKFLRDYRRGDFEGASNRIPELMINKHGRALKKYYEVMAKRMADYRENPPSGEWNGVFVATDK
jgi:adenylate cyclase